MRRVGVPPPREVSGWGTSSGLTGQEADWACWPMDMSSGSDNQSGCAGDPGNSTLAVGSWDFRFSSGCFWAPALAAGGGGRGGGSGGWGVVLRGVLVRRTGSIGIH